MGKVTMTTVGEDNSATGELTDEKLQELFEKIKLSENLMQASDLDEENVAELINLKLDVDFDVLDLSEGLLDIKAQLESELRKVSASLVPQPKDGREFAEAVFKNRTTLRHVENIVKGLRLIQEIQSDHDFDGDNDVLAHAFELTFILARIRVQNDIVPLVTRGLYSSQIRDSVAFWEENKGSKEGRKEATWQKELEKRPQILSHLLGGHVFFLGAQQHVGGTNLDGSGERISDYIYTHNITSNVTLVEIKTPHTPLLGGEYRGTYPLSLELSGSVSQVLKQRSELIKSYFAKRVQSSEHFDVDAAKCVVIAGSTESELKGDSAKSSAFEMQRDAFSPKVRIVTFDELYAQFEQFNRA
jgi:hypothetical protein